MGKSYELRIGTGSKYAFDGGLCLNEETAIGLSQSPTGGLLNICLDDGGNPTKRQGQRYVYETSLGDGGINGLYGDFNDYSIIAHKTKLYKQKGNDNPIEIYSNLKDKKCFMFTYNGILYLMNGEQYIQYDGETVKNVEPYKPRISMNRKPDGSQSTVDESWNMLGSGFRETFNGNGTDKTYKLSMQDLTDGDVKVKIGDSYVSGFTVNKSKGTVTFTNAPAEGTNNVEITAYKSFPDLPKNILQCTRGTEYANRMFLTGNSELKNYYFASGLTEEVDATYFPQKHMYALRGGNKAVTGLKVHHNKLVVFKEDMTATVTASTGLDNTASFPIAILNSDVGCDIPDSIQLVNNNIVFANTHTGVNIIVSTMIEGEKSIIPISHNINGTTERQGLLQEGIENLRKAVSIDFGQKYYLCVNGKAYVWDYKDSFTVNNPEKLRWFLYDNIKASAFAIRQNKLMYGHSEKGMLCEFANVLNDFGQPINAIWKSKLMDFGYPDWLKNVSYIWYTCKANSGSAIAINCYNDNGELLETSKIPAGKLRSFGWDRLDWDKFTWGVHTFAPTIRIKTRIKKVKYFQIELKNNVFNENLSMINLVIKYAMIRKVK